MCLEGNSVLHIVDTATYFSAATFLHPHGECHVQTAGSIWLAFIQAWCKTYPVFSNRLGSDQGATFTSDRWKHLRNLNSI